MSGVYDLFHIGHLNLLKNAKGLCDKLIVGDDWFNTESWQAMEKKFNDVGIRVVYSPYTKSTSNTQ